MCVSLLCHGDVLVEYHDRECQTQRLSLIERVVLRDDR